MAINAEELVKELISYTIVTDKNSLVKLLQRNGIVMPNNPSDKEVTVAVLTASAKSPNFKKELATFLTSKVPQATKDYSSFVGDESSFGFTGVDDFVGFNVSSVSDIGYSVAASQKKSNVSAAKAKRISPTNPEGKTGVGRFLQNLGKSLTSEDTINAGLNVGLTALNNKVQNKSNALQQETTLLTQQQDELRQNLPSGKTKSTMSTTTWVLIGVGVVALGATIYFASKNK